jgi:hypothetical protein
MADASTVSACAAPWMRPRCARPYARPQKLKNTTITNPPAIPIAIAHATTCSSVETCGSAASPPPSSTMAVRSSRRSDARGARAPAAKLPASAARAVNASERW